MFLPKRKLIVFLFLFCFVALLFFLSSQNAPYTFRTLISDLVKVPLVLTHFFAHEARAVVLFHKDYWQNLRLRQENEELKQKIFNQEELKEENRRLKELLDLKQKETASMVASSVIGRDFNVFRSYLLLDKGRKAGIKKYAAVINAQGLVGKVLEVGFFSSKVILLNDPDLSVPARNARTREQGLVSGTLDGRSKLRFLDRESDVREGDLIVTSGLNMTYPEDIPIGKVRIVGTEPSGLGKFAVLQPAVNLSTIEEVFVVRALRTNDPE